MRLEHTTVDIDDIVRYFIEGYEFKEGETLHKHEFFYDPQKGKVVFKLFINETGENE